MGIGIRCMGCDTPTDLTGDNCQVRRFSEEPWLNHVCIICAGCATTIFWFPVRDQLFEEVEEMGADVLMQQHPSDPFRKMYYKAHKILTSDEEKAVTQFREELELHADQLLEGGEGEK